MIHLHLDPRYSAEEEIERETEGKREGGRGRGRERKEGGERRREGSVENYLTCG